MDHFPPTTFNDCSGSYRRWARATALGSTHSCNQLRGDVCCLNKTSKSLVNWRRRKIHVPSVHFCRYRLWPFCLQTFKAWKSYQTNCDQWWSYHPNHWHAECLNEKPWIYHWGDQNLKRKLQNPTFQPTPAGMIQKNPIAIGWKTWSPKVMVNTP